MVPQGGDLVVPQVRGCSGTTGRGFSGTAGRGFSGTTGEGI